VALSITMLYYYVECPYAECRILFYNNAECHYAECRGAKFSTLHKAELPV